jgi:nitrogen fixation NifU-like protein
MNDLRELYQEVILDHGRTPRNFGKIEGTELHADGHNPLCGDRLTVYLEVKDGKVAKARFDGSGCAISVASASLMTEAILGQDLARVEQMFEDFQALLTGKLDPEEAPSRLGKLAVFAGVRDFPVRIKCATLAWHTLRAAETGKHGGCSTE